MNEQRDLWERVGELYAKALIVGFLFAGLIAGLLVIVSFVMYWIK